MRELFATLMYSELGAAVGDNMDKAAIRESLEVLQLEGFLKFTLASSGPYQIDLSDAGMIRELRARYKFAREAIIKKIDGGERDLWSLSSNATPPGLVGLVARQLECDGAITRLGSRHIQPTAIFGRLTRDGADS